MISLTLRLILIAVFSSIGFLLIKNHDPSAWFYFSAVILIVLDYFRTGSMWPAYQAYKLQDYQSLRNRLKETLFPGLLSKTHRAKYYFLKGVAEIQKENYVKSESYFHKALGQPGSKENDRGMIYAFLATIYLNRGQKKEAEKYLKKAKQTGASKAKNQMIEILEKKF